MHHLIFDHRFVSVEEIEHEDGGHNRAVANMKKLGVTWVLWNTNVVVYCMSKAKASGAYNQTANNIEYHVNSKKWEVAGQQ